MNRHHRRIRNWLATAVAIATPLAMASTASANRVIEPTLPGPGPIHHVHILRVSGGNRDQRADRCGAEPDQPPRPRRRRRRLNQPDSILT